MKITDRFKELEAETPRAVTPTPCRKNNGSARAPYKRYVPSLGVGDPRGLAQDLDGMQVYDDVEETETNAVDNPATPKLKSRRVGRSRHRIGNIDELLDPQDKEQPVTHPKPKIVFTSETPKKCFKSKTNSTSCVTSETPNKFFKSKTTSKSGGV